MNHGTSRRALLGGLFGAGAVAVLAACGQSSPQDAHGDDHQHSDELPAEGGNVDISDFMPQAGLEELARASELVVLGGVVRIDAGITIGQNNATYALHHVEAEEVLRGAAPAKTVAVALLTHLDGHPIEFAGRPNPAVGTRGVWLLQRIAPEFHQDGYVLTNQNSQLLIQSDGATLTGGSRNSAMAQDAAGLGLQGVLARLRALR